MKKIKKIAALSIALLLVFSFMGMAAESTDFGSDPSNAKYMVRIVQKESFLNNMCQNAPEFTTICQMYVMKNIASGTGSADCAVVEDKYITRLSGKMSALINENLSGIECGKVCTFRPMQVGNLLPESRFNKITAEKESEKGTGRN
ncbi:MAG: hypothetical protein HQL28_05650 [Candidatus Omnitrophica bacterium]|nr:hypothetical protein [Candidatus Omnitrophota bacterium]